MDELTIFEAANVIGCQPATAQQLLKPGGLVSGSTISATLEELEALAVEHNPWKQHTDAPDSYWITVGQAAEILALSIQRVNQLLDEDRLPHIAHHSGSV